MQSLYQFHWIAGCSILRYLKMARGKMLYYPFSHLDIVRYSDAD